jgi:hypothetical protein
MDASHIRSFVVRSEDEGPNLEYSVKRLEQYRKIRELMEKLGRHPSRYEATGLITTPRRCDCPKCENWHWDFFYAREMLGAELAAELDERAKTQRYAYGVRSIEEAFSPPCRHCQHPAIVIQVHGKDSLTWYHACLECPSVEYVDTWSQRNLEKHGAFEEPPR